MYNQTTTGTGNSMPQQMGYRSAAISKDQYGTRCGAVPVQQMISIPQIKHVVHQRPVIYETVSEEVSYIQVPVGHSYEQREYPQQRQMQCNDAPSCAPKKRCGC